ncbi:MAG: hypothetical protein ACI9ZD_000325 [Paracoccaceae bacterium]|jgi:hypothetical protein
MAEKIEKLKPSSVAEIAAQIFAMPVVKVTAPGGKTRESLRVHFANRTIVATQRSYPGRMRMEVEVLKRLTEQDAPVPKFLGGSEKIFFQEDVGSRRLSGEMMSADNAGKNDIAARAFESLLRIREAGQKSGLADVAPALGTDEKWVKGFLGTSVRTAKKFEVAPPQVDFQALTDRLHVPATTFLKWDARPGNASIGAGGQVYWFDWEHCGKRQGMEDFAWLAGDEFWPVGTDDAVAILQDQLPKDRAKDDLDYLGLYITFHIIQRLTIIHRRFTKAGWVDAEKAMKYDKIGVDPALGKRLCRHGSGWADRSPLTRPMIAWFEDCSKAFDAMSQP